jgi:hypothetical protein
MTLTDLQPVIAQIAGQPLIHDLRSITYLSTYPSIRALGTAPGPIGFDRFHQLAAMAYGWMPRVVRIDRMQSSQALAALVTAQTATAATLRSIPIADIAACLRSLVGASKVLHFVNDSVFPIWDSNIEAFRLRGPPPHNHMKNVNNYFAYVDEVHAIRRDVGFPTFLARFSGALNTRLTALGIAHYSISEVRVIEAAAFELAP